MKKILFALFAILAVSTVRAMVDTENHERPPIMGAHKCSWGPSYWCTNITTTAECQSSKHCIEVVWEKLKVSEDDDSVCGICKNMIQQARNQPDIKQTEEDFKAIFESSCKQIHVKPIDEECLNLVNQFIPELKEMSVSKLNPLVVCTVAGLCNSAHIDQLLLEHTRH